MNKLTVLKLDAKGCLEKGCDKFYSEDYLGSLECFHKAKKLAKGKNKETYLDACFKIGQVYSELEMYDESNKCYYPLLSNKSFKELALVALLDNYSEQGLSEQLESLINFGKDNDVFHVDLLELTRQIVPQENQIRLVKKKENYLLELANQTISSGDFTLAQKMIDSIKVSEKNQIMVLTSQIMIYLGQGDAVKTIETCETMLEIDERNISALTSRIMAYSILGDYKKINILLDELDALDIKTWPDVTKIAFCACDVGSNTLAYKYLDRCLGYECFDRELLILFALACSNLGKYHESKMTIVTLSTLYPSDATVSWYGRRIDKAKGSKTDFKLIPKIISDGVVEIIDYIEKYLKSLTAVKFCKEMKNNQGLQEAVRWVLANDFDFIIMPIVQNLAYDADFYEDIESILFSSSHSVNTKKEILRYLLEFKSKNVINLCINNDLITVKRPKNIDKFTNVSLRKAYLTVFVALTIISRDFKSKLDGHFTYVTKALEKAGAKDFNVEALSAVVAYRSKLNKVFEKKEHCCEIFNCDEEIFDVYNDVAKGKYR